MHLERDAQSPLLDALVKASTQATHQTTAISCGFRLKKTARNIMTIRRHSHLDPCKSHRHSERNVTMTPDPNDTVLSEIP
jgi:hypothetical protein